MNPIWTRIIHHTRLQLLPKSGPQRTKKFKVEPGQVTMAAPCPACRMSVPPGKTGS